MAPFADLTGPGASPMAALKRRDLRSCDFGPADILCVACIRNEALRLPYFLEYHRQLGVSRFIFVDNASTDGSLDFLLVQPDVHVYSTEASYARSRCGVDWLNQVLHAHARGRWVLTLDADELFVYPGCEQLALPDFLRELDGQGAQCLEAVMLDMYASQPISQVRYEQGADFRTLCPFFDADDYHERSERNLPQRGGPRHRLFWAGKDNPKPSPYLRKFPLVKWAQGVNYEASTHVMVGREISPVSGALLHFKLFSDLFRQAEDESSRAEHWDSAEQYRVYWKFLQGNPDLTAFHDGATRYENSAQLVRLGLMLDGTCAPGQATAA